MSNSITFVSLTPRFSEVLVRVLEFNRFSGLLGSIENR